MSQEIKVAPFSIESALAELQAAGESLETTFAKEINGANILDMVEKINEMKQTYEEILTSYKMLLKNNADETGVAIDSFVENEKVIADAIQFTR
ncbi:YwqI/YxiC family protein [Lentibacillus sp. L22]|uniref:YwqI/YxiC family protein n=1 Tax=Lentibacillus TaxID=175304 RepID=UPI0022B14482|nr:YwqI/YxiC family protein [Lentibacillus daqui]